MTKTVIAFCVAAAALVLSGCAYDRGYYDDGYYGGGYYDGYYGGGYYGGGYYGNGYYGSGYYPGYYDGYDYYGYAPGAYYGSVYWNNQRRHYDRDRRDGHWGGRDRPDRDRHNRDSQNRDRHQPNGWDAIRGRSGRAGAPNRDAANVPAAAPRVQSQAPVSGRDAPSQFRSRDGRGHSNGRGRSVQP